MSKRSQDGRPLLVVPIAGLEEKEYPFAFVADAEELGLEDSYRGEIRVNGVVSKVGGQFFLNGDIAALQTGECDRCLQPTEKSIERDFAVYYRVGIAEEDSDGEDAGNDEVRMIAPEESSIVLDDDIRQTLHLQIPMKNLCSEDCKGLCPQCGKNLNNEQCECSSGPVDPRWAKLAGLFNKDSEADTN